MSDNVFGNLATGLSSWRLWTLLGWLDIRQRYVRSALGPFWITMSMGVMVGSIGLVYGTLFGQVLKNYLPLVGSGLVVWGLISGVLNDSCLAYISNGNYIRQSDACLWIYVFQVIWRQLVMLAHNCVIIIILRLAFGIGDYGKLLMFIPGLAMVVLNLSWMAQLTATWSARYRDIPQMVASLVQLLFYVTPLMWVPGMLHHNRWILVINPFANLVDLVRAPLLGSMPETSSWEVAAGLAVVGWAVALWSTARSQRHIAYWI